MTYINRTENIKKKKTKLAKKHHGSFNCGSHHKVVILVEAPTHRGSTCLDYL